MSKGYEAIFDKIEKIFAEEKEAIKNEPYDPDESELSHAIRKQHYECEMRAIKNKIFTSAFNSVEPRAIHIPGDDNGPEQHYFECPSCYSQIAEHDDKYAWINKFCHICGQKLDWSGLGFDMSMTETKTFDKTSHVDKIEDVRIGQRVLALETVKGGHYEQHCQMNKNEIDVVVEIRKNYILVGEYSGIELREGQFAIIKEDE